MTTKAQKLPPATERLLWSLYRHLRGVLSDQRVAAVVERDRKVVGVVKTLETLLNVRPDTRVRE